jgi:hypothetical protein
VEAAGRRSGTPSIIVTRHSQVNERHAQPMDAECWAVHKTRAVWRRLAKPLTVGRLTLSRYKSVEAVEWIDLTTGEVLTAEQARAHGLGTGVHAGEMTLQRAACMAGLRPEPQAFARFLLKFRNKRRGIAPSVTQVRQWYATMTGQRADNTARLVAPLKQAGIIAGESVLGQLWQVAGKRASARTHESEDNRAEFQCVIAREKHDYGRIAKGKFYVIGLLKDQPAMMEFMAPEWLREVRAVERAEAEIKDRFVVTQ